MSKNKTGNFIAGGNPQIPSLSTNNGVFDSKDVYTAVNNNAWQEAGSGYYEIARSLRFRNSASTYLKRTPSATSSQTTWTVSAWVKLGVLPSSDMVILGACNSSSVANRCYIRYDVSSNGFYFFYNDTSGVTQALLITSARYRDPTAWYHLVVSVDTTQANAANRLKMFVNGQRISSFSSATYPSQNYALSLLNTSGIPHVIGVRNDSTGAANTAGTYWDGYITELIMVDGKSLDSSDFGYFDPVTNIWQPKKYTGSYGTNGFYLPFNDNSSLTSLGFDKGNSKSYGARVNTAQYSTTQSKFGGSSLLLNGSGDYVTVGSTSDTAKDGIFSISASAAWTAEFWVYFNSTVEQTLLENFTGGGGPGWTIYKLADGSLHMYLNDGTTGGDFGTSSGLLTTGQWYHIAYTKSGTTIRGYINGSQVVAGTWNGGDLYQSSYPLQVGHRNPADGRNFYTSGYINDLRITKGVARYTSAFTAPTTANPTNSTDPYWDNVVLAMPFNGVSGTYSFPNLSKYANNWTPVNFSLTADTTYDSMVDSPTNVFTTATDIGGVVSGNYCTWNPLDTNSISVAFSNANLTAAYSSAGWNRSLGTLAVNSGKWYWEDFAVAGNWHMHGVEQAAYPLNLSTHIGGTAGSKGVSLVYSDTNGRGDISYNGSNSVYTGGSTNFATNDVIGVALDLDNNNIKFYKNNTLIYNLTGILQTGAFYAPGCSSYAGGSITTNFGQRPFTYTPPAGYKSLNTTNIQALGTSTVGKAAAQPSKWFDALIYGGTGGTQTIKSQSMPSPDLVWLRMRNQAGDNYVWDTVRGSGSANCLITNRTNAEGYNSQYHDFSFTEGGFNITQISPGNEVNYSGNSYVSWLWKQSPTSGLNIVPYTGNGTVMTISHNLGVAPKFIMIKERTSVSNWVVQHHSLGWDKGWLGISTTVTSSTSTAFSNNTAPTSSNFTVGGYSNGDGTGTRKYIAYIWAEVPGFSKFGSFVGNGSTDGPFIHCGFAPKFVLFRNDQSGAFWVIHDTVRNTYNVLDKYIWPDTNTAEASTYSKIDSLSNGFKCRNANDNVNYNGSLTYYAAFAESPFALNNRAR